MPGKSGSNIAPKAAALVLRSLALFAILWQFRLLAADLADTPVYAAALGCAFAAAFILGGKKVRALPALAILILIPWITRIAIALPRFFTPSQGIGVGAIQLDSLLLNLDRNNFVSLFPFYWAAITSYFAARSRRFLRGEILCADLLILILYSIIRSSDLEAYRWPVLMIALFAGILFLQMLAFILSLPPEYKLRKREGILGGAVLFILVCLGGILLIRPSQEGAVGKGGGLLEPNLFHFDFSQVLRLESEISMNDDLAFIVRKDPEDDHIFLRRFVLSGYNPKQGFYRHETIDEAAQPQRLPDRRILLDTEPIINFRETNQEYFLVNFDSSALIAMKEPVEILPFDSWDASSFSSAYGVRSYASDVFPFEMADSVAGTFSAQGKFIPADGKTLPELLGLSPEEYAWYTEYGENGPIAAHARELTEGLDSYWEKVELIYETLKYGDYRYSLKPGIAPDGDQLGYFLFDAKRGYCSYYAFAMTLMLRSLGIPARVAAGFYLDPETNTFNYYPVRSDMAHAWVEVRFPGYGWIEYDPTSVTLAEDEEFRFSSGVPQDLFERLMREILENRSRLSPKEGADDSASSSALGALGRNVRHFLGRYWIPLGILLVCLVFLSIRSGLLWLSFLTGQKFPRKKTGLLWAHTLRRLRLAGYKRDPRTGEAEWAQGLEQAIPGVYGLYQGVAAARYAPDYRPEQWLPFADLYRAFSAEYARRIPRSRRILAWLCPPLALIKRKKGDSHLFGLLVILLIALSGDGVQAQFIDGEGSPASVLYGKAMDAEQAEFWERAIELYSQGMELYPNDFRFPWSLGRLYDSRSLYGLAWDVYRKAEAIDPKDRELLYQMAQTTGYLNETVAAVEYLERLLALYPDQQEAIGNLAWNYYKLHRLNEGERLLIDAQERLGHSPDFAMTLGTIYSEMFYYEDAKKWYLEAIAGGERAGDMRFASVAHYNLSLLEARFYHFTEALDRTNASLAAQNRSSGWLSRGELYLHRLDFPRTFADYQEAYESDNSPLSKINMAQAFQIAGRLEEARLYAEDCLGSRDLSWMINYGIDPVRYKRDIHQILWYTYEGLGKTETLTPWTGIRNRFNHLARAGYYRFQSAVHRHLFRKYSLLAADAYRADPQAPGELRQDALIQYYNAFEAYPRRAQAYLVLARDAEVAQIPQAAYSYDEELGALLKNRDLLRQSIDNFDPIWERDMIADTYADLAKLSTGLSRRTELRDTTERLYALNRGAIRQNGLKLPVELTLDASPDSAADTRRLDRALRKILPKAGLEPVKPSDEAIPPRFILKLTTTEAAEIHCELYDGGRGTKVWQRSIPLPSLSRKDLAEFARTLAGTAFSVR
ncbi:putative membrane protein [Treponema primitia ZAS-2]|uniref:Putative membrane protein n=1 Tax=Treponema primitia (strain ATCC BAA-887 / DSM 12427 / ZAS-2) TaxID=545694 RepID=F5YME3_TREPZ|nr:transglutaminase domain-containing protein [Treponema primitia]AEF86749.1 putative membrane protein [Treponema primitia ZAS-2]